MAWPGDAAHSDNETKAIHGPSHPTARAALRHLGDIREGDFIRYRRTELAGDRPGDPQRPSIDSRGRRHGPTRPSPPFGSQRPHRGPHRPGRFAETRRSTRSDLILRGFDGRRSLRRDHDGELETSLVLHLAPEFVHMQEVEDSVPDVEAPPRYTRGRVPAPPPECGGIAARPKRGTSEKGAAIFERYTQEIAAALQGRPTNDANA